ncbi:cytochrome P450-like protein [Asbolus verrucosus]|uniref:Cytochrome P450-like protein n=1 Tax=Asbolus verrucosus TaxID=1661398 RepID=A0A482W6S8_ASBVE|nr:cytochrome P450-like protein [Asbolus verrucosus]
MSLLTEYLLAFIAVMLIPIYYYYTKLRRIEKFFENFPTPPTEPFFGNARDFTTTSAFLTTLHKYTKAHGSMVHVKMGPVGHVLVCSDHKFLEFLLSSTKILKKSRNLKYLSPWLGDGLVIADGGPKWKTHRKLITPAFHFKILEQFVDIFESASDVLVQKLSEMSGSKSLDIYPYISRCTLDIICETAMGTKIDVQNNEASAYFKGVKDMCRIFVIRTMSIAKRYDFMFKFTKDYVIQQDAVKVLHDYTNQVIDKKRQQLKEKKQEDKEKDFDDLGIKKKKVFLDLILDASVDGQSLSPEEINEEVNTFMFGGHDTTATASTFILYCLANNKEVQDKVYEEQRQLFGDDVKDVKVTYHNLQEMKYLENTVKEGLRLYSPVPIFGRHIDQDIEYDGITIPKGVGVIVFAHGIHMNPEYYPDPEKFDPSRFESCEKRPPYAFIPFSAGVRNCIGQKYAILEIKSLVSKIVRNFELFPSVPEHKMDLAAETVLKSLNGVKIGLKLR